MGSHSRPGLAAAVANAGGLGMVSVYGIYGGPPANIAKMLGLAIITLTVGSMLLWNETTPATLIIATLILAGIGMSLVHSQGATGVSLVVFKSELGVALGIYNMLRFICGTIGVSIIGIILETGRASGAAPMRPFQTSFLVLTLVAAMGLVLTAVMPRMLIIESDQRSAASSQRPTD